MSLHLLFSSRNLHLEQRKYILQNWKCVSFILQKMKESNSSLSHMKNSCVVFCTPISTKICFLGCFSSFTWNYLDVWWNVIYTCHMWWYICHRCQCDDVWHTNTTYISHFSVHANSVPFVYLDVFSQTQFCFDEYLSFILTFVPDFCDCLCGTY